jgi:hypothetical protein
MTLTADNLQRDTLDLSHGQREFLTRELAEDALEPLLADGAAVTRVRHDQCCLTWCVLKPLARVLQSLLNTWTPGRVGWSACLLLASP